MLEVIFFCQKKSSAIYKKKLFFYFRTRSNVIDKRNSLFSQRGRCVIQIGLEVGKLQQTHILNLKKVHMNLKSLT